MTRSFAVICTAALIVALVFAGMTSVFSYLTAIAVEAPKCAGHALLQDYRTGIADIWGLLLVSAVIVLMIASVGRAERVKSFLRVYDLSVFESASMRITLGMLIIYSTLFMLLVMLVIITGTSAAHYNEISKYCLAASG